jgi:uncharacterized protein
MLGNKCNFNCKYCVQKEHISEILPDKINPSIYSFIGKLIRTQKSKLTLIFYGGEPLLYFDKIKEVVNKTKLFNLNYSIISNGSLMTREIVDFVNRYNISVSVSWDGFNSINTRNKDIFSNLELKNLIFDINKLRINSVLSAKNYPLETCNDIQKIIDEYLTHNPNGNAGASFEEMRYIDSPNKELLDIDYQRVQNEVENILIDCYDNSLKKFVRSKQNFVKFEFLQRYLGKIKLLKHNSNNFKTLSNCGDGFKRLDMDLAGNLYACSEVLDPISNIDNLDLIEYVSNYLKYDDTKHIYKNLCCDCKYYSICLGGCRLMTIEDKKCHTCKFIEAVGIPLFKYLNQED